jgi:hypothetical protein
MECKKLSTDCAQNGMYKLAKEEFYIILKGIRFHNSRIYVCEAYNTLIIAAAAGNEMYCLEFT